MYIYIDESGNFGWPLKAGSGPYMLFSLLVIEDQKSKRAISQAVSRAIVDLRKHHPGYKHDSSKRIAELKGSKELTTARMYAYASSNESLGKLIFTFML